ncbi:MAG: hypothetical protein HOE90_21355 [Bacteriovoracaceae bacterium]|jgi:hypothetical protein|nr:hypothetical protein [Bacteriovoracaceae bacterium]
MGNYFKGKNQKLTADIIIGTGSVLGAGTLVLAYVMRDLIILGLSFLVFLVVAFVFLDKRKL